MPRQLPRVSQKYRETVPGVGTFALEPVGNTTHSKGIHVYCQPEGSDHALADVMKFRLTITEEFAPKWVYDGYDPNWIDSHDHEDTYVAAAMTLVETFAERDATHYAFNLMSSAQIELEGHDRIFARLQQSRDNLAEISAGTRTSSRHPESIAHDLKYYTDSLASRHSKLDERCERLRALVKDIMDWCNIPHAQRTEGVLEVIGRAMTAPEAEAPRL